MAKRTLRIERLRVETYIEVKEARFYAYHGVLPQERRVGGSYTVTLRVGYDWSRAAETDEVGDTLDYAALYEVVKREMMVPSKLLEHVAGRIAKAVTTAWPTVTSLDLWLVKDKPPMGAACAGAGVEAHYKKE